MTIHKEGYLTLLLTLIVLTSLNAGLWVLTDGNIVLVRPILLASLIFFFLILNFFRSPKRISPGDDDLIISGADGKVVTIEEVEEKEYLKEKRIQISVFMSPLNVHVNRSPINGSLEYMKYHSGKYLVAWHPKSSMENERNTMVFENGGKKILIRQIAGALARRIVSYGKEGDQVKQGQEVGFIKFGSRVDHFLPLSAAIKVKVGDKVKGGISVLATF